ncbi:MAG TPA: alpha/beta hydrolase [Acidimicrobiales bacterium]|nr:alpha/beta hydrolase [Acidimicrobiales bacterium]
MAEVTDLQVAGGDGRIPARLYRPAQEPILPGLVYFHGGGWVLCGLDSHDGTCRAIADQAGCVVLSVDYRLAPEHHFPAAVEDAVASASWFAEHAKDLGVDPQRIAVGGDSAGANLAAVVALRARNEGRRPFLQQLLIYPVTDYDFERPSMLDPGDDRVLTAEDMRWFWSHYLDDPLAGHHVDASPLRADLSGLPPTIVVTAEYDPLRDDGSAYAARLAEYGVPVEHLTADGMPHGFIGMADIVRSAGDHLERFADLLAAGFRTPLSTITHDGGA